MARSRRLAILMTAASLAAPTGVLAQTTTGSQTPSGGGSTLTQVPDLGEGTGGTTSGTTGTAGSSGAAAGTLPNTGNDPRPIILAGLALLLSGLGLRLRTADEIF